MVCADTVARVLRPWLGTAFLDACNVCEQVCAALNSFPLTAGDLGALSERLNTLLFCQIRALTEGDMRVLLDDGRVIRVRVDDVDQMADELLYLTLEQLPRSAARRRYSRRSTPTSSISAPARRISEGSTLIFGVSVVTTLFSAVARPSSTSYRLLSPACAPAPLDALPCGSASTSSVFLPSSARQALRLTAVVVLPTPPF